MASPKPQLQFVTFDHTERILGWRFDGVIPPDVLGTIEDFTNGSDFRELFFSPRRKVRVPKFTIAASTIGWKELCDWDDEELNEIGSLEQFCQRLDRDLKAIGWRLPLEDELEIACGGELFPWGNEIPEGVPYDDETTFSAHKRPNEYGLQLNADTYRVEIVRNQLKLGDGGESVCGQYPWPIPWLSFCPAYRFLRETLNECLFETLEDAQVRPVLL